MSAGVPPAKEIFPAETCSGFNSIFQERARRMPLNCQRAFDGKKFR